MAGNVSGSWVVPGSWVLLIIPGVSKGLADDGEAPSLDCSLLGQAFQEKPFPSLRLGEFWGSSAPQKCIHSPQRDDRCPALPFPSLRHPGVGRALGLDPGGWSSHSCLVTLRLCGSGQFISPPACQIPWWSKYPPHRTAMRTPHHKTIKCFLNPSLWHKCG